MAVVYDTFVKATAASTNTITSAAFTITASANRVALLFLGFDGTNPTGITCSVGGVAGTLVSGSDSTTGGSFRRTLVFVVINPPSGSRTATASWTNNVSNPILSVVTASGADQSTGANGGIFAVGNSVTSRTLAFTSAAGDLTASICYTGHATPPTSSQTRIWLEGFVGSGDTGPGTANPSHVWSTASSDVACSGANIIAAGGGGGGGKPWYYYQMIRRHRLEQQQRERLIERAYRETVLRAA